MKKMTKQFPHWVIGFLFGFAFYYLAHLASAILRPKYGLYLEESYPLGGPSIFLLLLSFLAVLSNGYESFYHWFIDDTFLQSNFTLVLSVIHGCLSAICVRFLGFRRGGIAFLATFVLLTLPGCLFIYFMKITG